MSANLARVEQMVVAVLVWADTYSATPDAGSRGFADQIRDIALTIDGEFIEIALQNPNWAHRVDFQGSITLAHGANLPTHAGPIDAVLISSKAASPAPLDQIESERQLTSMGVTELTPHYNIDGTVIAHNGSSNATVKFCTYTRGVALQSPDVWEGAIIRGVLAVIGSPEGEAPEVLAEYRAQYAMDKQIVMSGGNPAPFQMPQ